MDDDDYDYPVQLNVKKVQFGDTIKRVKVYAGCQLATLSRKIRDLFSIPADVDFNLAYADYVGDMVTISDDDDVTRALQEDKIHVQLSNNQGLKSHARSGESGTTSTQHTSLQVQHSCPNIIAEGLKSVPQQICEALHLHEALLKISEDIVSKAVTGPVLVELTDFISKMTHSYLNQDSQSTHSRADSSTTQNKKNKNKNKIKQITAGGVVVRNFE